eukprot:9356718-Pyramimonas_sp.AAC.1
MERGGGRWKIISTLHLPHPPIVIPVACAIMTTSQVGSLGGLLGHLWGLFEGLLETSLERRGDLFWPLGGSSLGVSWSHLWWKGLKCQLVFPLLGPSSGPSWRFFGPTWDPLWPTLGLFEPPCGTLGCLMGRFGTMFGPLGRLGRSQGGKKEEYATLSQGNGAVFASLGPFDGPLEALVAQGSHGVPHSA